MRIYLSHHGLAAPGHCVAAGQHGHAGRRREVDGVDLAVHGGELQIRALVEAGAGGATGQHDGFGSQRREIVHLPLAAELDLRMV